MANKFTFGEFGKVIFRYASAQIISNIFRLVSGFLVVRFISPDLYGQFTGIGVYVGYIFIGQGGIINGLSRELPYQLGRKNDAYAQEMASSVFVLSIFLSVIASFCFFFFAIRSLMSGEEITGIIYLAYSIIGGLKFIKQILFTNPLPY